MIEGASYVVNYFGFNQQMPLWQDLRVRQAFMHAINRDAIIASLYGGAAVPANCVYTAEALVPAEIEAYAYDPEKAKALLEEAGWAEINGDKPIEVITYYGSPLVANVLAASQAMLAQVGINIVPRAVDTPTYNSIVFSENYDQFPMVFAGLQNGPDASNINIGLNEKQIPPAGANIMRIQMPEVTAALDAALGRDRRRRARRPLPGGLQGDQRQPALGDDVGGEPLRRRLVEPRGLRLDPGPGRRPLRGAPREVGDRRVIGTAIAA